MKKTANAGGYSFYAGRFGITTSQILTTTYDIIAEIDGKTYTDAFHRLTGFGDFVPGDGDDGDDGEDGGDDGEDGGDDGEDGGNDGGDGEHDGGNGGHGGRPWEDIPKDDGKDDTPPKPCDEFAGCDPLPWATKPIWTPPAPGPTKPPSAGHGGPNGGSHGGPNGDSHGGPNGGSHGGPNGGSHGSPNGGSNGSPNGGSGHGSGDKPSSPSSAQPWIDQGHAPVVPTAKPSAAPVASYVPKIATGPSHGGPSGNPVGEYTGSASRAGTHVVMTLAIAAIAGLLL
jgi:hypothetical protein